MLPVLKINLTTCETSQFILPHEWVREYVGGASLAARMLYDELVPIIAPCSPQATLLFLNGPLTGTAAPSTGRSVICGRSPATGLWGESNIGGFWGAELKKAGYDGLWLMGVAEKPVYIVIKNNQVEIRDAQHIWGLETYAAQAVIQESLQPGRPRVAVIGPAGEAQIPFALILTDHGRVAGRTGMGAIMGSKKVKAIAVEGSHKVPLAHPDAFSVSRSSANQQLKDDPMSMVARATGTAGVADYFDYLGSMPKKYFELGTFDGVDKVSGSTMTDTILTGVKACHACVIACGRVVSIDGDKLSHRKRKGPEYETIVGFGPNLLNRNLASIVRMGELCDKYGMDTISASNIIGLAFLLYEKGLLTKSDTDGLELKWGDMSVVEALLGQIVTCQGFGTWLVEGARSLGRRVGHPELAVEVNNLEVPYHDPRGVSGMALVYATSPRGACHNQSDYFFVDIGQMDPSIGVGLYDRQGGAEKAHNVAIHQNWISVFNSLIMCLFANVPPETIVNLLSLADENFLDMSLTELLRCGERGWNLKRIINQRLGLTRLNDTLPLSFLKPFNDKPKGADGYVPDFEAMLCAYYQARGWDVETGYPLPSKLGELGLNWTLTDHL